MPYAATALAIALSSVAAQSSPPPPETRSHYAVAANGESMTASGTETTHEPPSTRSTAAGKGSVTIEDRFPSRVCGTNDTASSSNFCIEGVDSRDRVRFCPDGTAALDPLWRREVDPATDAGLTPWVQVDNGGCPGDPAPAVVLTVEDFQRLPIAPSAISLQPADGRGLVNMPLIVYTDPAQQTLQTTVLGTPVTVRATPTTWAWDFGDGTAPLVTDQPGSPWPHPTVSQPYTAPGTYALTLTTTWTGAYQVNGVGPWQPVTGTATTTAGPITTTVEEAPTHLVSGPTG